MTHPILWDCHMHSSFSDDSDTPMESMISQAISLGLNGICFTEHWDPDFPDNPDHFTFSLDVPAYREQFEVLKTRYASKIDLRFGIELGLQPHLAEPFRDIIGNNSFDFVIGSLHLLNRLDPYYPETFAGRDESACYRAYFESILENLHAFSDIQTLGHMDYIVRYGPNKNREFRFRDYRDVIDPILLFLIEHQIALEVNSGGYHYGLGVPNPCPEILLRYRELGGEMITVGADAHTPDRIAESFDLTAAVLRDCGFSHYTVFKEKKPQFLSL